MMNNSLSYIHKKKQPVETEYESRCKNKVLAVEH